MGPLNLNRAMVVFVHWLGNTGTSHTIPTQIHLADIGIIVLKLVWILLQLTKGYSRMRPHRRQDLTQRRRVEVQWECC